jgi:hypothetical protein
LLHVIQLFLPLFDYVFIVGDFSLIPELLEIKLLFLHLEQILAIV